MLSVPPVPESPVERRWLWTARGATAASLSLAGLLGLSLLYAFWSHCGEPARRVTKLPTVVLLMLAHLWILWRLIEPGLKPLGTAARWGVVILVAGLFFLAGGALLATLGGYPWWFLLIWALLAVAQAVLLETSWKLNAAMSKESADKRRLGWDQTGARVYFIFFLLFALFTGALVNLVQSRAMHNASSAIGSLRTINTAQAAYAVTNPEKGFAPTLIELGPPPGGADLIDPILAAGEKSGYRFTLEPGMWDSTERLVNYAVNARPIEYGRTGCRNFWTDPSGVIHETYEDRAATAQDPPIG